MLGRRSTLKLEGSSSGWLDLAKARTKKSFPQLSQEIHDALESAASSVRSTESRQPSTYPPHPLPNRTSAMSPSGTMTGYRARGGDFRSSPASCKPWTTPAAPPPAATRRRSRQPPFPLSPTAHQPRAPGARLYGGPHDGLGDAQGQAPRQTRPPHAPRPPRPGRAGQSWGRGTGKRRFRRTPFALCAWRTSTRGRWTPARCRPGTSSSSPATSPPSATPTRPPPILLSTLHLPTLLLPLEVKAFVHFVRQLPHRYKVVIAGNHDCTFDANFLKGNSEG